MKKVTFLFCLFAATVAQAQTKEETIAWIKEKLEKCLSHPYKDWSGPYTEPGKLIFRVDVNECEITLSITNDFYEACKDSPPNSETAPYVETYDYYFEKVTMPVSSFSYFASGFVFSASTVQEYIKKRRKASTDGMTRAQFGSRIFESNNSVKTTKFFLLDKEPDIYSRMGKAIKHLATFCPQKKEAF